MGSHQGPVFWQAVMHCPNAAGLFSSTHTTVQLGSLNTYNVNVCMHANFTSRAAMGYEDVRYRSWARL